MASITPTPTDAAATPTTTLPQPPPWARPSHTIHTPRLILRSSIPSDADASTVIAYDPLNSPFGGLVGATKTVEERRETLVQRAKNAMKGENAFLVCVLKDEVEGFESILADPKVQPLKVDDGHLIGMTGFNEFHLIPSPASPNLLKTNIGALLHHPFSHHHLATEALQAVIEYGITTLKCDIFKLETDSINVPFIGLMKGMGLGPFEKAGKFMESGVNGALDGSTSVVFEFTKDEWVGVREGVKERGRWYL